MPKASKVAQSQINRPIRSHWFCCPSDLSITAVTLFIFQANPRAKLRKRSIDSASETAKKQRTIYSKVSKIVRKCAKEGRPRTKEEDQVLASHPKILNEVLKNLNKRQLVEDRKKEIEDSPAKLVKKCAQLSKAIQKAKNLVVYTGAGISTAANIPGILYGDFKG